jgi:hypothetical protein
MGEGFMASLRMQQLALYAGVSDSVVSTLTGGSLPSGLLPPRAIVGTHYWSNKIMSHLEFFLVRRNHFVPDLCEVAAKTSAMFSLPLHINQVQRIVRLQN